MKTTARGLALLTTALVSPVLAQDAEEFDLGTIRIESSEAQGLLGNAEITEQEIENRNPATAKDIFTGESSVTAGGGAAIAQKIFVNGVEESLLSVTIDGARQNKGAFHHTGNVLLDPALLKSVAVSEGLASADAGQGALGGSLAYTTKDARDLLEPGEALGGLASLTIGDNGAGFRGSLTLFGQHEGFEWLLSGTRQSGDDYEDGDGTTIIGTGADLTDFNVKTAYTTDSGNRLSFSASQTEDTGLRASQSGFIRPDFADVIGRDTELLPGYAQRSSYTLTYTDETPHGWIAPTLQLSYNEQEVDVGEVEGTNTSLSGIAKNEFALTNGTLTAGVDFYDEHAESLANAGTSGEEALTDVGVFAQMRQNLTNRISVSYGARYDYQWFDGANGEAFNAGGVSANGSVDFILTDNWTINAGLASTWGGYELGEASLVNYGTPWTYDGFTTSRANAARVGLRYENGAWEASGALFYTEIEDINAVLPSGGDRGATTDLVSQGVDASLGYNAARGFARVNYTYADVEMDGEAIGSTSYYLGRPMGHIFGLEAGYDITTAWRVGGTAEIALKNTEAAVDLPGYEVFNLYTTWTPESHDQLQVRLDVRNLFDETYASRSSDGIDFAGVVPLTEPGRTLSLTATMRF